jgi:hypothetical protein
MKTTRSFATGKRKVLRLNTLATELKPRAPTLAGVWGRRRLARWAPGKVENQPHFRSDMLPVLDFSTHKPGPPKQVYLGPGAPNDGLCANTFQENTLFSSSDLPSEHVCTAVH